MEALGVYEAIVNPGKLIQDEEDDKKAKEDEEDEDAEDEAGGLF